MSAPVEHRTVNLWPLNASTVRGGARRPRKAAVVPDSTETVALAAITSHYRAGRADIISGDSSASAPALAEQSSADHGLLIHPPTVPLAFLSDQQRAEILQGLPAGQGREVATFWSRIARTLRPAPPGRHSPQG